MALIPYSETNQFRELVEEVKHNFTYIGKDENDDPIYDESILKPTLNFVGTVKLHGTNCSIVKMKDGSLQFQSRGTILKAGEDQNAFFYTYGGKVAELEYLFEHIQFEEYIAIYGEWCGPGINKGTAIQQLEEKMFVIFAVRIDGKWFNYRRGLPELRIFNIKEYKQYTITIDFNEPTKALDLLNQYTLEVEAECPVAKAHGVSGIGEGIVWICDCPEKDKTYRFKTKGDKHSMKTEKKGVSIDVEAYNSVVEFVAENLSPARLEQGLDYLTNEGFGIQIKSIGEYLKWCNRDILKECQLEIKENNLDEKMINKEVTTVARKFFMNHLSTNL